MTARELAERVDAHLKHFEADPKINAERFYESAKTNQRESSGRPYYHTHAWAAGRWVGIVYVSYQGSSNLTRDEAQQYLDWLDAGNVGRHFEAQRAAQKGARDGT